jgi:hypothetical protein
MHYTIAPNSLAYGTILYTPCTHMNERFTDADSTRGAHQKSHLELLTEFDASGWSRNGDE